LLTKGFELCSVFRVEPGALFFPFVGVSAEGLRDGVVNRVLRELGVIEDVLLVTHPVVEGVDGISEPLDGIR
jgi:hypothetical protein